MTRGHTGGDRAGWATPGGAGTTRSCLRWTSGQMKWSATEDREEHLQNQECVSSMDKTAVVGLARGRCRNLEPRESIL